LNLAFGGWQTRENHGEIERDMGPEWKSVAARFAIRAPCLWNRVGEVRGRKHQEEYEIPGW
jgi:hypothetical protein